MKQELPSLILSVLQDRSTGLGAQLLYDLTEIVWKIGQCEKKMKGRKLWHKIPAELLSLVKFEIKSKEPRIHQDVCHTNQGGSRQGNDGSK